LKEIPPAEFTSWLLAPDPVEVRPSAPPIIGDAEIETGFSTGIGLASVAIFAPVASLAGSAELALPAVTADPGSVTEADVGPDIGRS
jgi:hypothetical protein